MNKAIEKEVQNVLKNRKYEAEKLALYNLSVARQNLEYANLEKQFNALKIEIAKNQLLGKNVDELLIKQEKMQKNMQKLLKNMNISSIEPIYHCSKCNDTGIVDNKYCQCRNEIINKILLEKSGFSNCNLPSFNEISDDENKLIYNKLQEWSNKFPQVNFNNIFITGKVGTGKTFLTLCVANVLMQKQFNVYFVSAFNMNNDFLSFCKTKDNDLINQYINCDILLIDDFGTEPLIKNITENYFYLILNERLLKNKATIINSNLLPNEILDRYGERIFSRLMNKRKNLVLQLEGEDKRLKK